MFCSLSPAVKGEKSHGLRKQTEKTNGPVKLTSFALSSVEQVVDGGSESFGLFFTGKVQTDLTGLRGRRGKATMIKMTSFFTQKAFNTKIT